MIAAIALMLLMQTAGSADPLPPVESYEFLQDRDDRCRLKEWTSECGEMSEPRLFRGVWRVEFEGDRFTPTAEVDCGHKNGDLPCMWLDGKDLPSLSDYSCPAFEMEFVGRRTLHRGRYGHLGMMPHKVVVDRLISTKRLPTECDEYGNLIRIVKPNG